MALTIVATLVPAGCSYDAGQLLVNKGMDSGANGGSWLDGNGMSDSPSTTLGEMDGAYTKGTGGTTTVTGSDGGRPDAPISGTGGSSSRGGAIGTGGVLGSGGSMLGGRSSGGAISTGGITGLGGISSIGGVIVTGGVIGSGGSTAVGGAVATGGATGSGGKTSLGGAVVTGGMVGTGGSTISGCGTTRSTVAQTFNFATGIGYLVLGPGSVSGSQVKYVTSGPAAKPALCSSTSGCAALSVPFASGAAAYTRFAMAIENFGAAINLVGATVTFSLAVDNPGTTQVPIQIQAYTQGDVNASYGWTNPVTVGGASLDPYAAATGFKDLTLPVTNFVSTTGKYCAATTAAIGIQVMNTAAITSSNAGTVTVYIQKITVTPPS